MSDAALKGYTPQQRAEDALYYSLCTCRDLRLQAERMPANSSAEMLLRVEREGWVTDAKARIWEMQARGWPRSQLLQDMARAERIAA